VVLVLTGIVLAGTPIPASAHAFRGRTDLPVPAWLFVFVAGAVVVVSFLALAVLWRTPRLEGQLPSRRLARALQAVLTSPMMEWVVRGLSLAFFVLVVGAAIAGDPLASANLASVVVFIWFWVGLAFAHALFGNLWATLSPWDTLARALALGASPRRAYPKALGKWPATILMFGFVWMELAAPDGSTPPSVLLAILAYTVITLTAMAVYGRETWNRNGEAFAVYFELLSRIAPLARDEQGRVVIRPVLAGLPSLPPQPGMVAFVMVLIGSTSFDGLSASAFWDNLIGSLSPGGQTVAGTTGLLVVIGLVAAVYSLSMVGAAAVARVPWHPLAVRFVHSLVPIAFAYALAHYFSLLVLEGQLGLPLLSDPLAEGWNLLGTRDWQVNLAFVSANVVWYVQVAAIAAGHVGGVVLAHDRAIAIFPSRRALRTQYALLAIMVVFTVGGLLILSAG
jgi:hypothetical protein